jgi:hypothetical protein
MPPVKSKSMGCFGDQPQHKYELVLSSNTKTANGTDKVYLSRANGTDKVYLSRAHAQNMLHNLNVFRKNSRFCDVEIVAGSSVLKVSLPYHLYH